MAYTRKDEERYLSGDERELVDGTHHPALGAVEDAELARLLGLVRERRDRAVDIAKRQRREMRGKGAQRGARAVAGDSGSKIKAAILAQAVKRLNRESERRRVASGRLSLMANAQRALALRQAAGEGAGRPETRGAGKGMRAKPSGKRQKLADPREAGRVSQFVKNAQARRDSK